MNTGVTSNPQLLQLLLSLNQQGLGAGEAYSQAPAGPQGFAEGGMVQGESCPCCGMPMPEGHSFGGIVGGIGKAIGGASKWVKDHPWVIPAAVAAPFAAPAVAGALGAPGVTGATAPIMGEVAPGVAADTGLAATSSAGMAPTLRAGLGAAMHNPYVQKAAGMGYDQYQQGQADASAAHDARMAYWLAAQQNNRPQGFADGGIAGWAANSPWAGRLFGQRQQQMPGYQAPGMTWDKNGFAQSYDPNNPWAHRTGNTSPSFLGDMQRLVGRHAEARGAGGAGGGVRPSRQPATHDALVRRQMNAAQLGGLDPAQQSVARLQALRETGRGVQDISAKVRADAANSQDQFFKQLFGMLGQADIGNWNAARDFNYARNLPGRP